jgi:putative membrane protein
VSVLAIRGRAALSVALGLALLGAFVATSDLAGVGDCFRLLGWAAPLVLLPEVLVLIFDTQGWRIVMPPEMRERIPFTSLYLSRMAGESLNAVTPTATVGGEPVKAHLLRRFGVAGSEAMASVVLARTALVVSQSMFVAAGTIALLAHLGYARLAAVGLLAQLVLLAGFTMALVRLQRRGLATAAWRALHRLAPGSHLLTRFEQAAVTIDRRLDDFHRLERPAFVRATAWHLGAWVLGVWEVQLIAWLIGAPVGFLEAFLIESLAQPIRAAAIVVPGALGVQEWGGMWLCTTLGMPEPQAVTLWLLKRARETVFDLVGLAYLGKRTYLDR